MVHNVGRDGDVSLVLGVLAKGESLAIEAPPYRGKTHLVELVKDELQHQDKIVVSFPCEIAFDGRSFLEQYCKILLKAFSNSVKSVFEESQKYLPNIRPKISMNALHGSDVRIDYHLSDDDIVQYLGEALALPKRLYEDKQTPMIIVFDEVHLLLELKGLPIVEMMSRSACAGVQYIFISSRPDLMKVMLSEKLRENIRCKARLNLGKITPNVLYFYIESQFKDNDIKVSNNIIDRLIALHEGEIAFIDPILSRLIQKGKLFKRVSVLDIGNVLNEHVAYLDDWCRLLFDSLSTHQKRLVIAMSKDTQAALFKGEFIYMNGLVSVPSIQTSIGGLQRKNVIHKEGRRYAISNLFFREWLKIHFL